MKKKSLIGVVIAVILVGTLATVVLGQRARIPPEIRIGINDWVGYGPFYIAQEKGFFAKRGLNVDIQQIIETPDRRAALIGDRLDGMGSTVDDLIIGAAQGVPAKMVLGLDESAGGDGILTSEDITDIKQFRGKTIAVQPGFVNHFFLLYILDENGLSSKDIELRPMDPEQANEAFIAKEVDIAVTWEPHLSQVRDNRPDGKTFLTTTDYPGLVVDVLVFRADFIEEYPDAVAAFVDAWYEALDFMETNPTEAHEIIGNALGLEPALVEEILTGVEFLNQEDNLQYHDPNQPVNVFSIAATANRLWQAEGYIAKPIDTTNLIDISFLQGSEGSRGWFIFQ